MIQAEIGGDRSQPSPGSWTFAQFAKAFVGFEELYVNFQVSSLFRWAYTFDRIELIGPHDLDQL